MQYLTAEVKIFPSTSEAGQPITFERDDGQLPWFSYFYGTMKITEILMAEHAVFHSLFDHIEATVPEARTLAVVKSLAVAMEKLTTPHSQAEDELFIEPLEHYFDQIGHKETFHYEHELIEEALEKVLKTRDLKLAKRMLIGAVVASRKHFDKEERIVFPMAERVLKARTLNELGRKWLKRRGATLREP